MEAQQSLGTSTKSWEESFDQSKDYLFCQCAKALPGDLLWGFCPVVWLHLIFKINGARGKPNAQSWQAAIPLNPLLGFWRRNTPKGPAASISELKVGAERL